MTFLEKISTLLKKEKIPYVIVGGHAVSLQGATRGTIDIDLVTKLEKKTFVKIEKAFLEIGLKSRLPVSAEEVYDYRENYIETKNLIAWNFYNPKNPAEQIDIIITEDLNEIEIDKITLNSGKIPIASINSLIKMKSKTTRPQDISDIKALRKIQNEN